MKVLNVSSIIPLEGLKRENDIVLRVQDYLQSKYGYDFKNAKSLPYVNGFLAKFSSKWRIYNEYQKAGLTSIQGYQSLVYPWISLPTSNFWVNYCLIPFNWLFFKICLQRKLNELSDDSDLIVAQNTIPDSIIAYWLHLRYGKPYIINVRGDFHISAIYLTGLSKVICNASAIITHSPTNYENYKDLIDLQLLIHPVDEVFFSKYEKEYSIVKLITVCRLISLKHIDWVINVLSELNEKGYEFEYHVVGDGPEMEKLKLLANKNGISEKIYFYGHQSESEVIRLMNESHIFVMPSYPETLGRAFLEAAAANCLCLGHKSSGVDGLFKHKESAIFVEKDTILTEIETILKNFSKDYVESYTVNSRHIVSQFTWEKVGARYENVYTKAAQ